MYTRDMPKKRTKVAERIEYWLRVRDMIPADLTRKSGISPATISRILSGEIDNPNLHTLQKIARALNVKSADLIGDEEHPVYHDPLIDMAIQVSAELTPEQRAAIISYMRFLSEQKKGDPPGNPNNHINAFSTHS